MISASNNTSKTSSNEGGSKTGNFICSQTINFDSSNLAPSLPNPETVHMKSKRRKLSENSEQELERIDQNSESDDDGLSVLSKPFFSYSNALSNYMD